MHPEGPVYQPPVRRRKLRRRRIRRRRLVAVAALVGSLLFALAVVPWAVDKVRSIGRADPRGAQVTVVTIHSKAVGATLHTTVVVPKGTRADKQKRPLLVFLHAAAATTTAFAATTRCSSLSRDSGRGRRSSPSPTAAITPTGTTAPTETGATT